MTRRAGAIDHTARRGTRGRIAGLGVALLLALPVTSPAEGALAAPASPAVVPHAAAQADTVDPPDPGEVTAGRLTSGGSTFPFLVYTPSSYDPDRPVPLVVAVHGCGTTADQMMHASRYNAVAEREGFVVLYPDVDAIGRNLPPPLHDCWKFFNPLAYFRGHSDPAAIVDMTRHVMARRAIDPERVYLAGISAGGLMASIAAATYPEVFAAVAVLQSAGYLDGPCFVTGLGIPTFLTARLAFLQMGTNARVVPRMVTGSTADAAFPASCADKATEQGLRTNNLVISGRQDRPLPLRPSEVARERVPGGRSYTVATYRDPAGCVVAEHWMIRGMPHAWPGGTADPTYDGYTDPTAPSGAEATWAFFERYRRSDTAMPCATSAVPAVEPRPDPTAPGADRDEEVETTEAASGAPDGPGDVDEARPTSSPTGRAVTPTTEPARPRPPSGAEPSAPGSGTSGPGAGGTDRYAELAAATDDEPASSVPGGLGAVAVLAAGLAAAGAVTARRRLS